MNEVLLLAGAGCLAGAMNALAGGGSFLTLPALIAIGVPSVNANASSSLALFPGGLASAWVYRANLTGVCGLTIRPLLLVSLAGGLAGSLLLLWTPSSLFDTVLPWLLLTATLALAFGRRIGASLQGAVHGSAAVVLPVQFLLAVYGGYFGGAVGLMMMAAWSLLDGGDVKVLNAPRTLLVSAANTVAVGLFAVAGLVRWRETMIVGLAALLGAYAGAHLGKRLPPALVRAGTLILACGMTAVFFWKAYAH